MEFGAEESTWYDFATGESATAPPDGALQVPGVDVDLLPVYDVGTLGMSPELPGALAFQRPLVRPDLVNRDGVLRELTFKSWWVEDNEQPNYGNGMSTGGCLRKRYVTVTFDIYAQSFSLHLDNDEAVRHSTRPSFSVKMRRAAMRPRTHAVLDMDTVAYDGMKWGGGTRCRCTTCCP
jgi:hypothetical protein